MENKSLIVKIDQKLDHWGEALSQKNIYMNVEIIGPFVFLILSIVLRVMMPGQIAVSEGDVVNGRMFPNLLLWVMFICSAVLLVQGIIKIVQKKPMNIVMINALTEVRALIILGIMLVTYLICNSTDLFVAGAIFCSLAFLLYFRCKKPLYYVITIGMAVVIYVAFRFGLNVRF